MHYKRIVLTHTGEPDVLQVQDAILPAPGAHEVCIKILAAGVAYADIMMRRGKYPGVPHHPFTPGYDIVGTVEHCGSQVKQIQPGQLVAALIQFGGYSQYANVDANRVVPVPAGVRPDEAVCLVLNYVTAYQILHRLAHVQAGERLLVHAAAGGVGTALLQLGRLAHLEMYGTASSSKHAVVVSHGAQPIDYRQEDFVARITELTGDGVDIVCDPIGGPHISESFRTLRKGGRLIAYGLSAAMESGRSLVLMAFRQAFQMVLWSLLPNGKRVMVYGIVGPLSQPGRHPEWLREDLAKLLDLLAQKAIQPIIAQRLPLEEAAHAHTLLEDRAVQGKIVLLPHG